MQLKKVTKLGYVDNPTNPNSDYGESSDFHVGIFTKEPKVGERFYLQGISFKKGFEGIRTSTVTKVEGNTFHTLNSIYKLEDYENI